MESAGDESTVMWEQLGSAWYLDQGERRYLAAQQFGTLRKWTLWLLERPHCRPLGEFATLDLAREFARDFPKAATPLPDDTQ